MAKAWKVKGVDPQRSYHWNAQVILPVKVEEVYSWAQSIRDPDKIKELHHLRISVKRLRYSMEFFAINYGERLVNFLKVLEDLQEQLGDIHDCDVIETILTDYLRELTRSERGQGASPSGEPETDAIGINALLLHYRDMRMAKYQAFVRRWDALEEADFKGQLLEVIKGESV